MSEANETNYGNMSPAERQSALRTDRLINECYAEMKKTCEVADKAGLACTSRGLNLECAAHTLELLKPVHAKVTNGAMKTTNIGGFEFRGGKKEAWSKIAVVGLLVLGWMYQVSSSAERLKMQENIVTQIEQISPLLRKIQLEDRDLSRVIQSEDSAERKGINR